MSKARYRQSKKAQETFLIEINNSVAIDTELLGIRNRGGLRMTQINKPKPIYMTRLESMAIQRKTPKGYAANYDVSVTEGRTH